MGDENSIVSIGAVDLRLAEWVGSVVDGVSVSFDPPSDDPKGRGVGLYLIDLLDGPPARTRERAPLQLVLRYLVTTWDEGTAEAHRMLGDLAFAAMENPQLLVELEALPMETWRALRVVPRPAFRMRVTLRLERPPKAGPFVRRPLRVDASPIGSLEGWVYWPDNLPVMGAEVEYPRLGRRTRTDAEGRFTLAGVDLRTGGTGVIKARGRRFKFEVTRENLEARERLEVHLPDPAER